jgi:hypothetical protein
MSGHAGADQTGLGSASPAPFRARGDSMSIQIGDPSRVAPVSSRAQRRASALILGGALAVLAAGFMRLATNARTYVSTIPSREPVALHPTGDFTHPTAGFALPEKVGPFVRAEVLQYDEAGRDISAGYNAVIGKETPLPVVVTVYVYPIRPGADLDAYFEKLLTDLGQMHGGATPQFRNRILLANGRFHGRYAVFGYEEPWGGVQRKVPLRSYVVLYRWKGWWVKWRATTPAPISDERMKAIVDLTQTLLPPEDEPGKSASPSESQFGPGRHAALVTRERTIHARRSHRSSPAAAGTLSSGSWSRPATKWASTSAPPTPRRPSSTASRCCTATPTRAFASCGCASTRRAAWSSQAGPEPARREAGQGHQLPPLRTMRNRCWLLETV